MIHYSILLFTLIYAMLSRLPFIVWGKTIWFVYKVGHLSWFTEGLPRNILLLTLILIEHWLLVACVTSLRIWYILYINGIYALARVHLLEKPWVYHFNIPKSTLISDNWINKSIVDLWFWIFRRRLVNKNLEKKQMMKPIQEHTDIFRS